MASLRAWPVAAATTSAVTATLRCSGDGPDLVEQLHAGGDAAGVRGLHERKPCDVAETERRHLQDDGSQVGPQDLGVGVLRPAVEVVLGVQPDADPGSDPATATLALVGARLRDGFDREALHLRAGAEARDARQPRVDDVVDARDGERRLGDVGGQHDPPLPMDSEHPVLLGRGQPRVERQYLELVGDPLWFQLLQRVGGVADLPLPGTEDEDVAGSLRHQLTDGLGDRLRLVVHELVVANLHGIRATRHLDDRRVVEMCREALGVDRGRGDDDLEVAAARQQLLEVAEDEVDVETSLVRLVDDDRVVRGQVPVTLDLCQQDAVGHHLDRRPVTRAVGEPDLVADVLPELDAELLGDPLGHRAGGDPARLRVADHAPVAAAAQVETDLRQLGGLPASGLSRHDHDLVVPDGGGDVVAACGDRQLVGIPDGERQRWRLGRCGLSGRRGLLGRRGRQGHGAPRIRSAPSSPHPICVPGCGLGFA